MVTKRYPQTRFEKFCTGLHAIKRMQPSVNFYTDRGNLVVEYVDNQWVTEGIKSHLMDLGFKVEDNTFTFSLNEQVP